ncbi:hypothetical protein QFZ80_007624 [Paenibacillus sp. V4I7]|nr:hypothetical protein [Paenibacillus sp. V4I7]MDQ0917730.1 hypothetical protein [Paenibacillus sp. V4I5]
MSVTIYFIFTDEKMADWYLKRASDSKEKFVPHAQT